MNSLILSDSVQVVDMITRKDDSLSHMGLSFLSVNVHMFIGEFQQIVLTNRAMIMIDKGVIISAE